MCRGRATFSTGRASWRRAGGPPASLGPVPIRPIGFRHHGVRGGGDGLAAGRQDELVAPATALKAKGLAHLMLPAI